MKTFIGLTLFLSAISQAKPVTCTSEFYPKAVAITFEETGGKISSIKLVKTEEDISGPKTVVKTNTSDLLGGSYKGDRKVYSFNASKQEVEKIAALKEMKAKSGIKKDYAKATFAVVIGNGIQPGKSLEQAAAFGTKDTASIVYLGLKDAAGQFVGGSAIVGWSGYFIGCQ